MLAGLSRAVLAATVALSSLSGCSTSHYSGDLEEVINAYRIDQGLPAIPRSPSLRSVAASHVRDLDSNAPAHGECNLHSWSAEGPWSPCCYTGDHAQASCMWAKPAELTAYPGSGYEIAAAGVNEPNEALDSWRGSSAHHDVILSRGMWNASPWRAMGAAMEGGYAVVWFGEEDDPAAEQTPPADAEAAAYLLEKGVAPGMGGENPTR